MRQSASAPQGAVGDAVAFAGAVMLETLVRVKGAVANALQLLERMVHVDVVGVAADLVRERAPRQVIADGQLVVAGHAPALAHTQQ